LKTGHSLSESLPEFRGTFLPARRFVESYVISVPTPGVYVLTFAIRRIFTHLPHFYIDYSQYFVDDGSNSELGYKIGNASIRR